MTAPTKPLLLVIEDDRAVLSSLKFALEAEGFRVQAFESGEDLLGVRWSPETACLVVDYVLPRMDGLALVSELRRRGLAAPAVLMTGNPSAALRERAAALGLAIAEKPFLRNSLVEMVREALNG